MTNAGEVSRYGACLVAAASTAAGDAALPSASAAVAAAAVGGAAPAPANAPGGASNLFLSIAPWLGLLVVVVIVGWFVIVFVRRMIRGGPVREAGFSLEDLRQMHRRGELDDEEFARAKSSLVGRARDQNRDQRLRGGWEESGRRGASNDE